MSLLKGLHRFLSLQNVSVSFSSNKRRILIRLLSHFESIDSSTEDLIWSNYSSELTNASRRCFSPPCFWGGDAWQGINFTVSTEGIYLLTTSSSIGGTRGSLYELNTMGNPTLLEENTPYTSYEQLLMIHRLLIERQYQITVRFRDESYLGAFALFLRGPGTVLFSF
jgi:hypothetical protein